MKQMTGTGSENLTGFLMVILAAMLWGTTGTTQHFAPPGSSPQSVGTMRLLVGAAVLLLVAIIKNKSLRLDVPVMMAAGTGLCIAAYQVCFFWGVSLTGVVLGTIVAIGSSPVYAGIIEAVYLKRIPGKKWCVSTMLSVLGCCLLLGNSEEIRVEYPGIILATASGLSYASYTFLFKLMLPGRDGETVMAAAFGFGALMLLPVLFFADFSWVTTSRGAGVSFYLGFFTVALSYFLFSNGLKRVSVSSAVTLSLMEPVTACLLGIVIIGERLSPSGWAGISLILLGLVLLVLSSRRNYR